MAQTEGAFECNAEGTDLRKAQLRMLDMLIELDRICRKHEIPYCLSGGTCLGAVRHGGFIPWDDDVDIDIWHTDYKRLERILPAELSANYVMQTAKSDKTFYRLYMKIVDKNSAVKYEHGEHIRRDLKYNGLSIDILPFRRIPSYRVKWLIDRVYKNAFVTVRTHNHAETWKIAASYVLLPIMRCIAAITRALTFWAPKEKVSHDYGSGMLPKFRYSWMFPPKPIRFEGHEFMGPAQPDSYLRGLFGDYMTIPPAGKREVHAGEIQVFESNS